MILEGYIDIYSYEYTYPVEEWVLQEFKKRPKKQQDFLEFLKEFATTHITYGANHNREDTDWHRLKVLLIGRLYEYQQTGEFPTRAIFILLDQALILDHDGNPIPNLLK